MKIKIKVVAILLCCLLTMCMTACGGEKTATNTNDTNAKSETENIVFNDKDGVVYNNDGITVTVEGISYDGTIWELQVNVENDTENNIKIYSDVCLVNGYACELNMAVECPAKSVQKEQSSFEKDDLCYLYELCGISTIDNVGISLSITDENGGKIAESKQIVVVDIEPFTIVEGKKNAVKETEIYSDDNFNVSLLTVDKDFFGLSKNLILYLLVENKSDSKIQIDFNKNFDSYDEILSDINNNYSNYIKMNGETVKCSLVSFPSDNSGSIVPGVKGIATITLDLAATDINFENITELKGDFVIDSLEADNYMETLATVSLNYTK